jgi:hypothetical protein
MTTSIGTSLKEATRRSPFFVTPTSAALGLVVLLSLLGFSACSTSSAATEAGDVAGIYASLRALESALNGVHSIVGQADDATKDRLADADSRMQRTVRNIDDIVTRHEKNGEKIAIEVLNKTFDEGSEELFTAGLAVQDAQVDLNQTIGNAIVNAANVISGLPLTNVKPFVAFLYPTVLLPDTTSDYDIQLLGYFPDDLGKPQFVFPDGKVVQASVGADNRLHLAIPINFVSSYKGKRVKVVLKYRTYKRFLLPDDYSERDIWLDVLPSTVLAYRINAQALPDTIFDRPVIYRDAGTPADAGEARNRDIPWGFDDLTPNVDFANTYDKAASAIESTVIVQTGGNNPTGDNSCSLTETAGQRVVLHEYAHGKPSTLFGGGAGADVYCKIAITLKLARRGQSVAWHFKNSAAESGNIDWGGDVELFPQSDKELNSALLDLTDFTFDPPQHRTLSLNQSYRSKFVQVSSTPTRISLVARTLPRVQ